jgi:acyl-CoA thioesterase-1
LRFAKRLGRLPRPLALEYGPEKRAFGLDPMSGSRFSEEIMLEQKATVGCQSNHNSSRSRGASRIVGATTVRRLPHLLSFLLLAGMVSSLTPSGFATPALAQDQGGGSGRAGSRGPVDACLGFTSGLSLGTRLGAVGSKLRSGGVVTIVALGSSSTTGFGAFGGHTAFPDVMKDELLRLHPGVRIELINSGRIMEDLGDNIARLDDDVLRHKPDLVIWQIGTNDVVWRGIADNAKGMLNDAVRRIKAAKSDVVLLDLQYAPLVTLTSRYERMEKMIADVAAEQSVGHFPRFVLMKRAIDAGVSGLVSWDGLHNSSDGYACVGIALARMIDAAARSPGTH